MSESIPSNNNRTAGVVTTAALVSIFVYSFVVSLPAILINEVVDAFSLEGADEGLMGTMVNLGFMFSLFFVILVQGRAKKSTILLVAMASQAVMLFVCGFSFVFHLFCVGCVLVGFSGGFIDTFSNSSIVDVRKHESAKHLGYLHGLFGVGSLLSPLVFFWMLRHTDWRGVHYALAIASTIVMLLIFLLTRGFKKPSRETATREHLFTRSDLFSYMRIKRNIALTLAGMFSMFTIASVMVWIVRYMTLRYNAADLGALSITVYWICATANRFLLAQVVKRAPMKFFALGALLSGVFLLTGIVSGNPVVLCVMIGAFGFCSGHFVPVLVSECAVGYEGKTTFTTSLLMFIMCIGRIAAPVLMAFVGTQISLTIGMLLPVAAALLSTGCGWYALKSPCVVPR